MFRHRRQKRRLSALSASFYVRQERYIVRFRRERVGVANNCGRSMVSTAGCDNDLTGQTISQNEGMIV
jgi:hypothetical protein